MIGLIITIHVIICILLIVLILIQAGRGGGLVDSFSSVESMFGTKTPAFLTRTTTILSVLFFITCVSLALLSVRQSRSLMKDIKAEEPKAAQAPVKATPGGTVEKTVPAQEAPETPKTQNK